MPPEGNRGPWKDFAGIYYPGRGTLAEQMFLQGKSVARSEERAELILRLLGKRGVPIPPISREQIMACNDLVTLGRWFDRALTVRATDEIFTDDVIPPAR
jgi:hypothetical protein